jgi:DNA-directed RNA polymerase subunit beta'
VAQDASSPRSIAAPTNGIKMRAIVDAGQVVASLGIAHPGPLAAEDVTIDRRRGHRAEGPR